jgi:hypothetical protein
MNDVSTMLFAHTVDQASKEPVSHQVTRGQPRQDDTIILSIFMQLKGVEISARSREINSVKWR